jgi:hypothetical protein
MRVKSPFTGFFAHHWAVVSRIPAVCGIGMFAILITTSFTIPADRDLQAKQINLLIREIGHRLLLQAGDSTSRVMPVTEVEEGTFLLRFENELVFNHDSLMVLTQDLLPKAQFPSGYTVTVHDCKQSDIVYGFQVNNTLPDILPCRGRSQPVGCYSVEFSFLDFYERVEQKKAQINDKANLITVDPQEPKQHGEEIKKPTSDYDISQLTEQLKSFKADPPKAEPIPLAMGTDEFKTTIPDYPFSNLIYSGVLVLLVGTLLIARFGKIFTPVTSQDKDEEIIRSSAPELPAIGKFLFDVKNQRLLLDGEVISLTDKECRILELLNKSFDELISRETLMQEVWINEGVITGRSLDMFVSKLRKKLSSDPEVRITNVHGKGYRLEISEMQIS